VRKRDRGKRERVSCECYTLFSSCSRPLMICVSPIIRKIFSLFTLPVSRVRRSQIITCYGEGERKRGREVREREGVKERCEEGDRGEHY
jgi:hypothetical protein